jgi:hypothetical protein
MLPDFAEVHLVLCNIPGLKNILTKTANTNTGAYVMHRIISAYLI